MEKAILAADELTGFVGACALVRPSKKIADVPVESVLKRLKEKVVRPEGRPRVREARRRGVGPAAAGARRPRPRLAGADRRGARPRRRPGPRAPGHALSSRAARAVSPPLPRRPRSRGALTAGPRRPALSRLDARRARADTPPDAPPSDRERPRRRDALGRRPPPERRRLGRGRRHPRARRGGARRRGRRVGPRRDLRAGRRRGTLALPRLRPDPRPPLPDAPEERPRRPPAPPVAEDARLAGRGRARRGDALPLRAPGPRGAGRRRDDRDPRHGDRSPHGRRLPRGGGVGPQGHERERPDGRPVDEPARALRRDGRGARRGRAPPRALARDGARAAPLRLVPALRGLLHRPDPPRGGVPGAGAGRPRPHPRLREPRRGRPREEAERPREHRVPAGRRDRGARDRPRARDPHERGGAAAPRHRRDRRRALPLLEPEARLGHLPRPRLPRPAASA